MVLFKTFEVYSTFHFDPHRLTYVCSWTWLYKGARSVFVVIVDLCVCGCWERVIESKVFGFVPVMCFLFPHTSLIGPSVRRQTTDMWRKKERVWERRRVVHYGQCEQIRHSWRSRFMHTHIPKQYLTSLFMEIKIKTRSLCCKTFSEILNWDVVQLCHSDDLVMSS